MSLRHLVPICSAASAAALALATPALAAQGAMPGDAPTLPAAPAFPPPVPGMPSAPGMPDMRPAWSGPATDPGMIPGMPDARTRDAWLGECQRRTEMYYDGWGRRHRRDRRDAGPGAGYCEAYFDDYYRSHAQRGSMMAHARPMMMAPMAVSRPCEEVLTTEYVPISTRIIPRRPAPRRFVPDKRIRVTPDKRQRLD